MIRELKPEIMPLTRELALRFRDMKAVPGERSLKSNRLALLRQRYDAGLFHSVEWVDAVLTSTGDRFRVNGNTSSNMLCDIDPFPLGLHAKVSHFTCDSLMELAELHAQYDNPQSARTSTELVEIGLRSQTRMDGVTKTSGRAIASGLAFFLNGLSPKGPFSQRGVEKLPGEYPEFTLWANRLVGKAWLHRAGVVGMMYRSYTLHENCATQFWKWVREEGHPDPKHPSRVLAKFLLESYGKSFSGGATAKRSWGHEAIYRKCLVAWNAFANRRSTDLKYYANASMPEADLPLPEVIEEVELGFEASEHSGCVTA